MDSAVRICLKYLLVVSICTSSNGYPAKTQLVDSYRNQELPDIPGYIPVYIKHELPVFPFKSQPLKHRTHVLKDGQTRRTVIDEHLKPQNQQHEHHQTEHKPHHHEHQTEQNNHQHSTTEHHQTERPHHEHQQTEQNYHHHTVPEHQHQTHQTEKPHHEHHQTEQNSHQHIQEHHTTEKPHHQTEHKPHQHHHQSEHHRPHQHHKAEQLTKKNQVNLHRGGPQHIRSQHKGHLQSLHHGEMERRQGYDEPIYYNKYEAGGNIVRSKKPQAVHTQPRQYEKPSYKIKRRD